MLKNGLYNLQVACVRMCVRMFVRFTFFTVKIVLLEIFASGI